MRHVDEWRDERAVQRLARTLHGLVTRPWSVMEVCGGQTRNIARFSLEELLPRALTLVHGPGCPVCVTPAGLIDQAIELAADPRVVLCTFGDMLRVPGRRGDLLAARARGGDVRVVWSPLDALAVARAEPGREVVLFAVGFETTAPTTAMAVLAAERAEAANLSLLAAHVLVPPAVAAILSDRDCRVQALLAAGHVCTVQGLAEYRPLARRFGVPIVATGFEPVDLLLGLVAAVRQLERGEARVENRYRRTAADDGNPAARAAVARVFEISDQPWRGLGVVAEGGLRFRAALAHRDAQARFGLAPVADEVETRCRAAEVLQGKLRPEACPEFGAGCTPDQPLGAPMVSSEGACAAYWRHRRRMASSAGTR